MGYYSDFEISAVAGTPIEDLPDFDETFLYLTDYSFFDGCLSDIKWYDSNAHMKSLSALYPDTVFRVYWNGEDSDDAGIAYYWNNRFTSETTYIPEPKLINLPGFANAHPELLL
jgi:hypothetical protein